MMDSMYRIAELGQQGFCCSQILLQMGLDAQGKENPDVIRAMGGLCGGMGYSGKNCGALTGGVCLMSLYVGRGILTEQEVMFGRSMISELIQWFEDEYGLSYGGIDCVQILEDDPLNRTQRCPGIIQAVYEKTVEILEQNGISIYEAR